MVPAASPCNPNRCLFSVPCSRFPTKHLFKSACSCLSYLNQSCEQNSQLIPFWRASMKWAMHVNCSVVKADKVLQGNITGTLTCLLWSVRVFSFYITLLCFYSFLADQDQGYRKTKTS